MRRTDPRYWKGKVRVSEITYKGFQRFVAQWRSCIGGEPYWCHVRESRQHEPTVFLTLDAARDAATAAYDNDMDVALSGAKKVWP